MVLKKKVHSTFRSENSFLRLLSNEKFCKLPHHECNIKQKENKKLTCKKIINQLYDLKLRDDPKKNVKSKHTDFKNKEFITPERQCSQSDDLDLSTLSLMTIYDDDLKSVKSSEHIIELFPTNKNFTVYRVEDDPRTLERLKSIEQAEESVTKNFALDDQSIISILSSSDDEIGEMNSCLSCKIRKLTLGASCSCTNIKCICNHIGKHKPGVYKKYNDLFHIYSLDSQPGFDVLYRRVVSSSYERFYRQHMLSKLLNQISPPEPEDENLVPNLSIFALPSDFIQATSVHSLPTGNSAPNVDMEEQVELNPQLNEFYNKLETKGLAVLSDISIHFADLPEVEPVKRPPTADLSIYPIRKQHAFDENESRESQAVNWEQVQRLRRKLYYKSKLDYLTMYLSLDPPSLKKNVQKHKPRLPGVFIELQCNEQKMKEAFLRYIKKQKTSRSLNRTQALTQCIYQTFNNKKETKKLISECESGSIISVEVHTPFSSIGQFMREQMRKKGLSKITRKKSKSKVAKRM